MSEEGISGNVEELVAWPKCYPEIGGTSFRRLQILYSSFLIRCHILCISFFWSYWLRRRNIQLLFLGVHRYSCIVTTLVIAYRLRKGWILALLGHWVLYIMQFWLEQSTWVWGSIGIGRTGTLFFPFDLVNPLMLPPCEYIRKSCLYKVLLIVIWDFSFGSYGCLFLEFVDATLINKYFLYLFWLSYDECLKLVSLAPYSILWKNGIRAYILLNSVMRTK